MTLTPQQFKNLSVLAKNLAADNFGWLADDLKHNPPKSKNDFRVSNYYYRPEDRVPATPFYDLTGDDLDQVHAVYEAAYLALQEAWKATLPPRVETPPPPTRFDQALASYQRWR